MVSLGPQRLVFGLNRLGRAIVLAAALVGSAGAASAEAFIVHGVAFRAASENVRLLGVSGQGTLEDPFVVVEEIVEKGEAILSIEVRDAEFGSRVGSLHATGFALRKIVINRTDEAWAVFNLELEFHRGLGSDYFDGLSFAQSASAPRPFRSDVFQRVEDLVEPRDVIRFSNGEVAPGDTVMFQVAITHTGIAPNFLLVQHSQQPTAQRAPVHGMTVGMIATVPDRRRVLR